MQKIKFRVSNGNASTIANGKAEKEGLSAPKQNASISANCKINNLFNSASSENNYNYLKESANAFSAAKETNTSNPIFTTSPFVTFSTLHAKNLQSTASTAQANKAAQKSFTNPKEAKHVLNQVSNQASTQASTQDSTPTNMDCNSSLDKSVKSCNQSISNALTRTSTSNSIKYEALNSTLSASRLHYKEKTINNFTSNFLINGNSKSNKNLNESEKANEFNNELNFDNFNNIASDKNNINNKKDNLNLINANQINAEEYEELHGLGQLKSSYQMEFPLNSNAANSIQESNTQIPTTTICLNLASLSSLNLSNSLNSFSTDYNNSTNNLKADHKFESHNRKKLGKKIKELKIKNKRQSKEGSYNCGRWQPEEHQRFIEAIMKYGNEWKQVQKHVGTRSSTQARSHAQKFFVKIKKSNVFHFNIDLSKNSIKTLHEMANSLNTDEYFNAIKALNCVAFERKSGSNPNGSNSTQQAYVNGNTSNVAQAGSHKRKIKKEDNSNFIDLNNFFFSDLNGNFNIM